MPETCPQCGANLALVGKAHRCVPVVGKPVGKSKKPKTVFVPTERKTGRPRVEQRKDTLKSKKPWKKLGMSERTYFRRQAEARNKQGGNNA